ncbi:hypothetical protein O77CONTIG1_00992 [Leptolyngbya sp. O-77]|nr:hypothetical protein O77CONTIG1_00992 [Leptolyngbya sp. O-77]
MLSFLRQASQIALIQAQNQARKIAFSTMSRTLSNTTCQTTNLIFKRLVLLGLISVMTVGSLSCSSAPANLRGLTNSGTPLNLSIREIQDEGGGTYTVSGTTSLPSKTKITVSAVRYLVEGANPETNSETDIPYAILDRQIAEVGQGNWQAELNLWQIAPDGKFQEAWQLSQQDANVIFTPDANVTFLATFDPVNQPENFKAEVEKLDTSLQAALARFTPDGELYLQASRVMAIALPTGQTTPPQPSRLADGVRRSKRTAASRTSQANATQEPTSWRKTTAPLKPAEMLR